MTWIKAWLAVAEDWWKTAVAGIGIICGILVYGKKLFANLKLAHEGGLFLINVKENFETARIETKKSVDEAKEILLERLDRLDRGQANTIQTRRMLLNREVNSAFFECDMMGGCVWVSRLWRRMTGLDIEEARGNGWEIGIAPENRAGVAMLWAESIAKGRGFESEVTYIDRDGMRTSMKVFADPIEDDHTGKVIGWFGHCIRR